MAGQPRSRWQWPVRGRRHGRRSLARPPVAGTAAANLAWLACGEPTVRTRRLLLRPWRDADREPFAIMNSDPRVMEHFVEPYSRERSDSFLDRIRSRWGELGYGLWATKRLDTSAFVGYVGLWLADFDVSFTPAVEVG